MIPVQFGPNCGWFHPAAAGDRVVVLCPTIGFESLAMYRPFRMLADQLAASGYGTLRFDYPGTGDAPGDESEPDRLRDWLDSVDAAVAWVRQTLAPREVVLCGLQFGGLLATLAASRLGDIDRLVLLAPIVSGRTYVRAQKAMMSLAAGLTGGSDDGYLDAPAQRLHPTTVAAIAAVNLAKLDARPARSVLLMEAPGVERKPFIGQLESLGAAVTVAEFTGYDAAMRDAHLNDAPLAAFAAIASWLQQVPPGHAVLPVPDAAPTLPVGGATETRMQFTAGGHRLVGVLCRPTGPPRLGLIITNTGSNPHFGYGRFAVSLSRIMARHGVATLRMDMAGAGDSVAAGKDLRPHLFEGDRTTELRAAADLLDTLGIAPLAAAGICSGAFYSLTAAMADERVRSLVLINQDVFVWGRTGVLIDLKNRFRNTRRPGTTGGYAGEEEQVRLTDLVHKRRLRSHLRRLLVAGAAALDRLSGRSFPLRAVRTLSARGTQALFMTGDQDAALDLLQAHFGHDARRLRELPGMTLSVVNGLDHTLGSYTSREMALPVIERFLVQQLGTAGPLPVAGRARDACVAAQPA